MRGPDAGRAAGGVGASLQGVSRVKPGGEGGGKAGGRFLPIPHYVYKIMETLEVDLTVRASLSPFLSFSPPRRLSQSNRSPVLNLLASDPSALLLRSLLSVSDSHSPSLPRPHPAPSGPGKRLHLTARRGFGSAV